MPEGVTVESPVDEVSLEDGDVSVVKEITRQDWDNLSSHIQEELETRRGDRSDRELLWDEVDRQVAIEFDMTSRTLIDGSVDPRFAWKSRVEVPYQAQSLEALIAESRQLMFPDNEPWFVGHMVMSDDYLERNTELFAGIEEQGVVSVVTGDKLEIPSMITQDYMDRSSEGLLNHYHRQYGFFDNWDKVNAEAFKYGTGVGVLRPVEKSVVSQTTKGTVRERQKIPMFLPKTIRNVYLDISRSRVQASGYTLSPTTIECKTQKAVDVILAANKGSTDPDNIDGGWMLDKLEGLEADKNDNYEILEMEGDIVIPRDGSSALVLYNSIATVAVGGSASRVIRFRFIRYGDGQTFPQTIEVPYENDSDTPYGSSPLLKGMPVQKAISFLENEGLDATALKTAPPTTYSPDDALLVANGGPNLSPHSTMEAASKVEVLDIGDPAASFAAAGEKTRQYYDVVGVNPPRLGAQTKSHTTATAKQIESQKGNSRTVAFVKRTSFSPMATLLYREYIMGKQLGGTNTFYVDKYGGYITVSPDQLPDDGMFEVFGGSGPAEQAEREGKRQNALERALKMDVMRVQMQQKPFLDWDAIQKQVLLDGGFQDIDGFINTDTEEVPPGQDAGPGVGGDPGGAGPGGPPNLQAVGQS